MGLRGTRSMFSGVVNTSYFNNRGIDKFGTGFSASGPILDQLGSGLATRRLGIAGSHSLRGGSGGESAEGDGDDDELGGGGGERGGKSDARDACGGEDHVWGSTATPEHDNAVERTVDSLKIFREGVFGRGFRDDVVKGEREREVLRPVHIQTHIHTPCIYIQYIYHVNTTYVAYI